MYHRRNCVGENARKDAWLPTSGSLSFSFYLFPLIISHISTFCHTQPFPPLSSHLRKEMWFPFSLRILTFCPEDHCWQSHLMQCNEANPFSLSSFLFVTKTFVTNCVLCWTGTSSCGSPEKKRRSRHVSKDRRD